MPPQTTPAATQLAEVARLHTRLSLALDKRGSLLETFANVRRQHNMEFAELKRFQQLIIIAEAATDASRSEWNWIQYELDLRLLDAGHC